jgi:hypothetical protein
MARARLLVTQRLLSSLRDPLENISGAVVLGALFVASAQLFNCLAPEAGLLHLLFNLFFAALLWNTLAAEPDAPRLLRSLVVVFGSAFAIKYIILASLYDPAGGMLKRVLTILLEGVTLGALDYQPHAAVTGYVAFAAIGLFMLGAFLLSQGGRTSSDRFAESVDTDESGITTRQVHGSDDRQSAERRTVLHRLQSPPQRDDFRLKCRRTSLRRLVVRGRRRLHPAELAYHRGLLHPSHCNIRARLYVPGFRSQESGVRRGSRR